MYVIENISIFLYILEIVKFELSLKAKNLRKLCIDFSDALTLVTQKLVNSINLILGDDIHWIKLQL